MDSFRFGEKLNYQMQLLALTDKEEQKEIARHCRGIERDTHKSYHNFSESQ